MRRVFFAINITADGFCGHEDGIADAAAHRFFTEVIRDAGVMIIGRVTYQLMVPFWPEVARTQSMDDAGNEFARVFDSIDRIVVSRTLKQVNDPKARIISSSPVDEVIALKKQPGKDILVGGLSIASQLAANDLVDDYILVVNPVVAGRGPRLFDTVKMTERRQLEFVDAKSFESGVIALHYRKLP